MSFSNPVLVGGGVISDQSITKVVTQARHMPGTVGRLDDGRTFEYVRSQHGTAIPAGSLACYDPMVTAQDTLAVAAAAAVGAFSITVTATLTLTKNELLGAYLGVEDDAGEGQTFMIIGHDAHTSGSLVLKIATPIKTALTTSSTAAIFTGPTAVKISAAVVADASPVEVAAGVPQVEIPIGSTTNQYAWVQKTGISMGLFGTIVGAVGDAAYQGELAGSFQASVDTSTQIHQPTLGVIASLLPIDTEHAFVKLNIT